MALQRLSAHVSAAAKGAGNTLRSRYGIWGLALISFIESALLVPIVTDPFLLAYALANKRDILRAVFITTLASVLGGIAAYLTAVGFFEIVIVPYIAESTVAEIHRIAAGFEDGAFILTLTGALTPLPYTLFAMGAGLVQANFFLFILVSVLGRGLRYTVEGVLVYRFGDRALNMAKKQIMVATILCVLLIVAYLVIKF